MIFTLLFVDLFDTAGTLIGVELSRRLPRQRRQAAAHGPRAGRGFRRRPSVGALLGTSNTTSYIESAAGVEAGGRTGLTGVFVAVFFLLALFFSPLAGMIPKYASAAALLYVACVMTQGLAGIDWDDITEYAPAVVTAIAMPLTYLDRDRDRARLHHLCAVQDPLRPLRRGEAGGDGAGRAVRREVRGASSTA